ncbi:hypothetical protein HW555_005995 [Spodoptera exigua]|uniref:Uncharacterized protein n=1 Tax=Spodoptera exigua TaxID=7107 RepID=A0A835GFD1_SPOEX|nr:hypothetical protein HW555_005995 [Spodoptera exigua]
MQIEIKNEFKNELCIICYLTARLNGVRLKRTMAVEAHERRALRPRRANRTRSTNGAAQAREFETLLIPQYISERARSDGAAETRDCKTSLNKHKHCTMSQLAEVLSAQKSLEESFMKKMSALEAQIQTAGPAKDTVAKVAEEFRAFRELVISMLGLLRRQIGECSRQLDNIETRSRRKALIFQGIAETAGEDCTNVTLGVINNKLGLNFTKESIKVCHRLGQANSTHHRPILVWRAKTGLRGSKVSVREFLTKLRQSVFGTARQHFGMRSCWTQEGAIFIKAPDGGRHKVTTLDELNPLLSKYPKAQGSSVGKRSPESTGEGLKVAKK